MLLSTHKFALLCIVILSVVNQGKTKLVNFKWAWQKQKKFKIQFLGLSLWCYQCVSTQPGCGTPFNWLWHWTKVCPEDDDVCVKIIEQKDGS